MGCAKSEEVTTGDHAEAMCFEQRLYVEAGAYKNQVKQAESVNSIPIPECVKEHSLRNQHMSVDREAYPLRVTLVAPNWPFHY